MLSSPGISNAATEADGSQLVRAYIEAKNTVLSHGFGWEIDWQRSRSFENVTESVFLREYAWVVLASGMKEAVVRRVFPEISSAFFHWESTELIVKNEEVCRVRALERFRHPAKIGGIVFVARLVYFMGFSTTKRYVVSHGLRFLQMLPYLGPATSRHLAKNIGFPFAKPDRHLVRIADAFGYKDVQRFCEVVAAATGDSVGVVGLIFWRFGVLRGHKYIQQWSLAPMMSESHVPMSELQSGTDMGATP